jgi:GH25 family lysozyme M1 (1,4-beta-N-acetylmuramidase)
MSYWQYSCTGRVPGVAGDVDLNIFLTGSKFMGDE